jgi:hypothetical protein
MTIGDVRPQDPSEPQAPNDTTPPTQDDEQNQEDKLDEDQAHDQEKALIKGEMRMMGIIKAQGPSYHTQECTKPYKEITPRIIFLVISKKGVTTRSRVANFCQHYSFISSIQPFKIEYALRDLDWVVAMQEELNNFKRNQVWFLVERAKQSVVGTKWVFRNKQDEHEVITRNKVNHKLKV